MVSASAKNLINYIGKTKPSQIKNSTWKSGVQKFCETFEAEDKTVKNAQIILIVDSQQGGGEPHKSRDDPPDPNDVISVRFTDDKDKRVASAHVYKDGTGKVVRW